MKFIIILAIVSILSADETKRIESIVEDISNLRDKYENCQKELDSNKLQNITPKIEAQKDKVSACQKEENELKEYKKLLKQEHEKNEVLTKKAEFNVSENSNTEKIDELISKLEKELENKNKLLKNKDNEIISLKKKFEENREKSVASSKNDKIETAQKEKAIIKACKDENRFPKLIMKEKSSNTSLKNEDIYRIKPTTFRLKENSIIYNSIDGQKVYEWEESTSFTSNIRSDEWIKITGYFVDRTWQKASEELWVKNLNVIQK